MNNFNRKIWEKFNFNLDRLPNWPCPTCWETTLSKLAEFESKILPCDDIDEISIDEASFLFSGFLTCKVCGNLFCITGKKQIEFDFLNEEDTRPTVNEILKPVYIYPNLRFFKFNETYPDSITEVLDKVFSLYYSDVPSATNMLRVAVEKLLDHKKLGEITREDSKGSYYSLHARILEVKNKNIREKLMAVKWIGNSGAHLFEHKDNNKQLLDAIEIFHIVLEKLFSARNKEIEKITKEINTKKGKPDK